jgi:hypothetical protein
LVNQEGISIPIDTVEGSEDFKKTRGKKRRFILDLSDGILGDELGIWHELGLAEFLELNPRFSSSEPWGGLLQMVKCYSSLIFDEIDRPAILGGLELIEVL